MNRFSKKFSNRLKFNFVDLILRVAMAKTNILKNFLFSCFVICLAWNCSSEKVEQEATFAGSESCFECHKKEYNLWKGSDHDNTMDTAIASTVKGDFNNAVFKYKGFENRFYIKDGKFFVHTLGAEGKPGDFQIAYTFGVRPLQQYLVPFGNGRLQCLPVAWYTEKKQWYHLADSVYKNQDIKPDDWLYWTNNGQNWNGMCAECHSTNLKKNYNPETHVYHTTWSEIDVSCEACHGPGSRHNQWAAIDSLKRPKINNYGLDVKTSDISSKELVDQCAFCHSRRTSFGDFGHPRKELFDIISPQLPVVPYYYSDGQILEEDYIYASFTQSKMYHSKVRCSNCHDVHSLKLKYTGNKLCAQCHKPETYDTYNHHFHKGFNETGESLVLNKEHKVVAVGEGSLCINCHMPGRYYMGVDFRRDHSMRIPRPDLSKELGTPNACNQCHTDKTSAWAASYTEKWYGKSSRIHFGKTMYLAGHGDTNVIPELVELIKDTATNQIVAATATSYLANFHDQEFHLLNTNLLNSSEPLVRREAIRNFIPKDQTELIKSLAPLLFDSLKMIRLEAISKLAAIDKNSLDSITRKQFNNEIGEYVATMKYTADFATSRHNLGNLYKNLGQYEMAEKQYKEALQIDNQFYPAEVNLAMLYNKQGRNEEAEILFKNVLKNHPDFGDIHYSLGLLLAEEKKYDESVKHLQKAADILTDNARVFYNLGNLQDFLGMEKDAESNLSKTLSLEPDNPDYLISLIKFYMNKKDYRKAQPLVQRIQTLFPEDPSVKQLVDYLNNSLN